MDLTQLVVQQNNGTYERVDPGDIEVIYDAFHNNDLNKLSNMRGALDANFAYKSHCDELKYAYRSLKIRVGEYYQEWDDPEFQRCISALHGDGVGVIKSDLIKQINLTSSAMNGDESRPFYGNKKVKAIDMRPFENFKYNRNTTGQKSNLCVVKATDKPDDYQFKEVYISSANSSPGYGFTPFSFIEEGNNESPTYFLDKVWYESTTLKNEPEQIYGHAGNYSRCGIEHFYWLNHSIYRGNQYNFKEATMNDGTLVEYNIAAASGWNSRGSFMRNIILDSPVPIVIPAHSWGNNKWGQTRLWVPDAQLDAYNFVYSIEMQGDMPASISTMSNYNSVYRDLANWWRYPGKATYQTTY